MKSSDRGPITCLLLDNGSLRPASTLALRQLAQRLGERLARRVEPVSLLHSSAVGPDQLDGQAAEILEPAIRRRHAGGVRRFLVLPLFFGPSAALTDYLPRRIQVMCRELSGLDVRVGRCLVDMAGPTPSLIAQALIERVASTIAIQRIQRPDVILVDHGSPQPAVGAVRDHVAREMTGLLSDSVRAVQPSSMERRDGIEFDFNDPLLARALENVPETVEDVVVSLMFFSPGRHAGPGGDIEQICSVATRARPKLRVHITDLVGDHPLIVEALAERFHEIGITAEDS